ncbi:MAG: hypothetical protein JRN57_01820 [Nitrososphaerota archaeon]|nr:hypothetical protein [Nitrososphaerota archaeon]
MQKPVPEARDTSYKTAELVKLISDIGPDVPEISRRLGQFKESVRYRYKEKVLGRGFSVHALPNHEKLGLRRVALLLDFAPPYETYAHSILSAMNELCYVVYFEKRMFRGDFLVEASVPAEHLVAFTNFMLSLKDKGLLTAVDIQPFEWFRIVPMRAEAYDFDSGRWDFDWSTLQKSSEEAGYRPGEKIKFDREDLLILKELQIDATRSFIEVAAKLKENYKKLSWHYKTHVLERELVNGYNLRWMGTSYSTVLEKALHRKHRYQHLAIMALGLTEVERMDIMTKVHGVPFIWSEAVGVGSYAAHFYFPTEHITESFKFLTDAISSAREKVTVMALDQTEALSFTISYQLFDDAKHAWTFDGAGLASRFDDLIQKIVEIGGTA